MTLGVVAALDALEEDEGGVGARDGLGERCRVGVMEDPPIDWQLGRRR